MGKLIRLELYNFKSYKGHHTLLFGDAYFTSIIGPNGSGKSNSMDAISFVLGIKSSHLRSAHLKELVYRGRVIRKSIMDDGAQTNGHKVPEDDSQSTQGNDPRSAWVMAVYEDDAGEEQRWKRTITNQGASEYRINDRQVTAQQYNESLEAENILMKARNFLVFQGDVEAIAIQKPQDLTRMLEQVSGSLEYKADYDRLKAEYEEIGDQQAFQLQRRRAINTEVRVFREQKDEADKYREKTEERDEAIATHMLWKLYHLQQQIEESSASVQRHQNDLKDFRRGIEKFNKSFETAKKEYTEAGRDVSKADKAIKAKEKEIEEQEAKLLPIDEQITVSSRSLTKYDQRISTIKKERDGQANQVKELEKQLKTIEKAQALWQAQWEQTAGKQNSRLSDADLKEYTQLREQVNKEASASQSHMTGLKAERSAQAATYNNLKNAVESTEFRLQNLKADRSRISGRQTDVAELVAQTQKEIDEKRKQLTQLSSQRLQASRQQTELEEKLQEVARKIAEADDGRRASDKEIRIRETIATLKRTYPGVRGRLHELCKPKQKKFAEAVSTVLGRHFDSVVVDTETTAKQCIEYLREQRAGQATFIPLDTIQVKPTDNKLKGSVKGVQLAIDTIDYDNSMARAITYACGSAIVCDTLDIAKKMAYERDAEAKVVTLDGTVIHKGGLITGGRSREQNSRRWDEAEVDRLNKLKDKLINDIYALPQDRVKLAEEQALQNDLVGLEGKLRFVQEELDGLERNMDSKQKELDHIGKSSKKDQSKLQQEKNKLDQIDKQISDFQEEVSKVEDKVFAAFCRKHGFENIQDYEARQGSLQQEAAQKNLGFITQKGKLSGQLNFERTRLQSTDDRIQSLRDKDARDRQTIDELNEQKTGIQDDLETLKSDLDELQARLQVVQEAHQEANDKLSKSKQELQKRSKDMDSTLKAISALEADMQKQSSSRYTLLRRCKIENIQLPLEQSSEPLDALPITDAPQVDEDSMEVDAEDDDDPTSSALKAHEATNDYGVYPDYDSLDDDLKQDSSSTTDQDLAARITTIQSALEKLHPQAHAATRLATTERRLAETDIEFSDTRAKFQKTRKDFETVQRKRNDLFNKAFSHISEQIEPIYSNLTKSSDFPAGGRAYLTADTEEPYLAGVNYHTMPPAKRFRDMEHLSGGEKTMAALALLFAVHSYQPSPFFVLDEVDAALDNANVGKLVNYVRNHAGPGMQFIVISLKTGFFQGSEALVGVYRDQGANSSRCLTLDLRKYT